MGSFVLGLTAGPRLFPMTPEGDVAEVERVPPGVEHGDVEAEDTFAGYAGRRRNERSEAVVNGGAFCRAYAGEEVPERESVTRARFVQYEIEGGFAARWIWLDGV